MSIRFDRLKQIAEDVRNAKPETFNLSAWKWSRPCGTVTCAIGHHIDAHPEAEFKWGIYRSISVPVFGDDDGFDAVEKYLGLSGSQSSYLFDADDYPLDRVDDREYVASRIEQFIRDHRESPVIEMKADAPAPVAARQLEGESQ